MHSWVCFDCRASYRRQPHISEVACAKCGQLCTYLGTKVPIPRKANEKAWELLRTAHLQRQRNYLADVYRERVAFTHSVAREIARLSALPANPGRQSLLRELKKALSRRFWPNSK